MENILSLLSLFLFYIVVKAKREACRLNCKDTVVNRFSLISVENVVFL